jgi:hypothetical protein
MVVGGVVSCVAYVVIYNFFGYKKGIAMVAFARLLRVVYCYATSALCAFCRY